MDKLLTEVVRNELFLEIGIDYFKKLGVMKPIIDDYKNGQIHRSEFGGITFYVNEEDQEIIKELEESDYKVIHVIDNTFSMDGEKVNIVNYLLLTNEYISGEVESLENIEKSIYRAFAYVYNKTWGIKEYGYIGISELTGGMVRRY